MPLDVLFYLKPVARNLQSSHKNWLNLKEGRIRDELGEIVWGSRFIFARFVRAENQAPAFLFAIDWFVL